MAALMTCSSKMRHAVRSVLTPVRILVFMTSLEVLIYFDRGLIGAVLNGVQEDLNIESDFLAGLLGSGFIFGFMIACPIFAHLAKTFSSSKLMAAGVWLWCFSVLLCGFAQDFWVMFIGRTLSGIGEASFAGLAPTSIDDIAPKKRRTFWLSIFFAGLPIGVALGYVAGGLFVHYSSWRYAFFLEGLVGLPIALIQWHFPVDLPACDQPRARAKGDIVERASSVGERVPDDAHFTPLISSRKLDDDAPTDTNGEAGFGSPVQIMMPNSSHSNSSPVSINRSTAAVEAHSTSNISVEDLLSKAPQSPIKFSRIDTSYDELGGLDDDVSEAFHHKTSFFADVAALLRSRLYVYVSAGYTGFTFVVGGLALWAPKNFAEQLNVSNLTASLTIGSITFVCGLVGTAFGGWLLDRQGGSIGYAGVAQCLSMSAKCVAVAIVAGFGAVMVRLFELSMAFLAVTNFFLFATTAPISAAILSTVPGELRSLAMSLSVFFIHLLGDFPSPLVIGAIVDLTGSVQVSLLVLCAWMTWPLIFWTIGCFLARKRASRELDSIHTLLKSIDHDNGGGGSGQAEDSLSFSHFSQGFGFGGAGAGHGRLGEVEITPAVSRDGNRVLEPRKFDSHPLLDSPKAQSDSFSAADVNVNSSVHLHETGDGFSLLAAGAGAGGDAEYVSLSVSRPSTGGRRRRDSDSGFSDLKKN